MLRDRAAFSRQPLPIEEAWLWSPTRRLPTAVVWQQPLRQILSRVYLALAAPGRLNNRNDPCQLFLTWNLYLDLQAAGTNSQVGGDIILEPKVLSTCSLFRWLQNLGHLN